MERLPQDIIMDIISRLPIKHVLRCRCVCKSWETITSTPMFATTHFNRASALNFITHFMITYHNFPNENLLFFVEDDKEDKEDDDGEAFTVSNVKPINFPFLDNRLEDFRSTIFIGACNGFVCFSTKDMRYAGCPLPTNPIYIFNPITGQHILLPKLKETQLYYGVYGFGLDASTQEYKVVVFYFKGNTNLMQVLTVGSDCSWRMYDFDSIPGQLTYVLGTSRSLLFNGTLHWIILNSVDDKPKSDFHSLGYMERDDEPKRALLLSFQLDTEHREFLSLPKPLQVVKLYFPTSMEYALQLCGGCLSVAYSPSELCVEIWVMKNYRVSESWTKQYSIQLSGLDTTTYREGLLKPLGFRKNGELMLYLFDNQLVSYNTENGKYKILQVDGELPSPFQAVPLPFVGSLISLKSAAGVSFLSSLPLESILQIIKVIQTSEFDYPTERQLWALNQE